MNIWHRAGAPVEANRKMIELHYECETGPILTYLVVVVNSTVERGKSWHYGRLKPRLLNMANHYIKISGKVSVLCHAKNCFRELPICWARSGLLKNDRSFCHPLREFSTVLF